MEGTEIVSSPSDMLSGIGDDFFTDATAVEAASDAEQIEAPEAVEAAEETPTEEPAAVEEPAAEEAVEAQPEAVEKPAEEAKPAEDLPEGVRRGKDRSGKEGLWLTPQRYENFHGAWKTANEVAEILGEPLTPQAVDLRQRAWLGQEKLYGDLLSGEQTAQANAIDHFFNEAQQALESGAVATDPMIPLATTFYEAFKQRSPEGYAQIRKAAAQELIEEMYQEAGSKQNRNLWVSAGHFAKTLGFPYKKEAELQEFVAGPADPHAALRQENEQLKAQLSGKQTGNRTAQYDTWRVQTNTAVSQAVMKDAVEAAIPAEVKTAWEKWPDDFKDLIVDRLHKRVDETVLGDARLKENIKLLQQAAYRAVSAQRRTEIADQIKQTIVNRAKLAADSLKGPILKRAAELIAERSKSTAQRRTAAQNLKAPGGPSNGVPKSLIPGAKPAPKDGFFDASKEAKDLARIMAAL